MEIANLFQLGFEDLHKELREDLADMTVDDLFWRPAPGVTHAGFLLWHVVRDEDTVIHQSLLAAPELWVSGGWAGRFGMDEREQGTGFEPARLDAFRYDPALLWEYAARVWSATGDALSALTPARLDEPLPWDTGWRLGNLLLTGCLAHGWSHFGEIRQIRGLRGWRARE